MNVFTYHLAKTTVHTAMSALLSPPKASDVHGLIHAECMTSMTLGSSIVSPSRMKIHQLAVFAKWENQNAIDDYLENTKLGRVLAGGWYVRLVFQRRWGHVDEFDGLADCVGEANLDAPVVAVTLARLKLLQVPRFIRWGKPVEELVRDHPGITLATASIRLPRTVSTFSVWKTQREMLEMVWGNSSISKPKRHDMAMKERQRKDFHSQFTTLRFKALSEHGQWDGRSDYVPSLNS
ncbi:MAG: hypothetical protein COA79_12575 [Planctomycetota bacterium]|nr:MAG: hypothetical protein COA79_12575 [Planctomycetota bacterium]